MPDQPGSDRIARIVTSVLSFPLDPPFRAALRLFDSVEYVLAEVATGQGVVGLGYCFAFGRRDAAVLRAMLDGLAETLVGAEAADIAGAWRSMWNSLVFVGQAGIGVSALGALDMALWDIAGKAAGLPLHRLLGGSGAPVPVYGSGGSLAAPLPDLLREMEAHAQAGYQAVKMKIGQADSAEDLARVAAVRRAIGPGVRLILDANQRWSPREAIRAAARLAEHDIWWLEEPIPAEQIEQLRQVREASPIAIATGETNFTPGEFGRLLRAGAADVLTPNLQRVGGISAWRDIAAAAALHGVRVASHVYPEINAHLIGALPAGLTLEVIPWWPVMFREQLAIAGGQAEPPQGPGLGLSLDPAVVARHRLA